MLEENKTKIDGEQSQTLDSKIKNFLLKLRIVFRIGRSMGGKPKLQIHERHKIYKRNLFIYKHGSFIVCASWGKNIDKILALDCLF